MATESPGLIGAYVATNHGYPTGDAEPPAALREWQQFAATTPDFRAGEIVARACVRGLPDDVLHAYDAPFPDESFKQGARAFPALIPVTPDDPASAAVRASRAVLAASDLPFLTVYGAEDPIAGAADGMFHHLVPGAAGRAHARLADAGHNMPEEAGQILGEHVVRFLASL